MTSQNKASDLRHIGYGFCLALILSLAWLSNDETLSIPAIKSSTDENLVVQSYPQNFTIPPVKPPLTTTIEVDEPEQRSIRLPSLYPELERIIALDDLIADEALALLEPFLQGADPVIRLAALESLGDMKRNPGSLSLIVSMLDDPNPQIRIAALEAIAISHDATLITNIEAHIFDRDTDVRIAAIQALVSMEDESATPALASLLSDPDSSVRHHAVNALGEIGGELAINYLQQARYDSIDDIRENTRAILEELGTATIN